MGKETRVRWRVVSLGRKQVEFVSSPRPPDVSVVLVGVSQDCAAMRKVRTFLLVPQQGCQTANLHRRDT